MSGTSMAVCQESCLQIQAAGRMWPSDDGLSIPALCCAASCREEEGKRQKETWSFCGWFGSQQSTPLGPMGSFAVLLGDWEHMRERERGIKSFPCNLWSHVWDFFHSKVRSSTGVSKRWTHLEQDPNWDLALRMRAWTRRKRGLES